MYDFAVVGGGPAGSAAAHRLATEGASVALIDKPEQGHNRPGEHISGSVANALQTMAVSAIDLEAQIEPSPAIVSHWEYLRVIPYDGADGRTAFNTTRAELNALMRKSARRAGAKIIDHVVRAISNDGGWRLSFPQTGDCLTARFLVDATGRSRSMVPQQETIRSGDLAACTVWFEKSDDAPNDKALIIEAFSGGWWSVCGTPANQTVAVMYFSPRLSRQQGGNVYDWWERGLEHSPLVRHTLNAAHFSDCDFRVFPCYPTRSKITCGVNWVAIGDAAVAYDPICGQGVKYSIESGFRAAEALLCGSTDSALNHYNDILIDRYDDHLEKRKIVYLDAESVFSPDFLSISIPN